MGAPQVPRGVGGNPSKAWSSKPCAGGSQSRMLFHTLRYLCRGLTSLCSVCRDIRKLLCSLCTVIRSLRTVFHCLSHRLRILRSGRAVKVMVNTLEPSRGKFPRTRCASMLIVQSLSRCYQYPRESCFIAVRCAVRPCCQPTRPCSRSSGKTSKNAIQPSPGTLGALRMTKLSTG